MVDAFQLHGTGKLIGVQLVNKLPAFDVNQKILTVLTIMFGSEPDEFSLGLHNLLREDPF